VVVEKKEGREKIMCGGRNGGSVWHVVGRERKDVPLCMRGKEEA